MNNLKPKKTDKEKGRAQSCKIRAASLPNSAISNSSANNSPNSSLLLQSQRNGLLTVEQALAAGCFPPKLATGLYYLNAHCPTVRKAAEMASYGIPYLPSFLQRANPYLRRYCGLEIRSRSLRDGTGRVEYFFCPCVQEGDRDDD
ncbi:hypothetical protein ACE02H_14760 [Shewanella mangrovisoli]|uniref:hypothetical protein n=1 Tax=Shewanella mangrovisoli TaxID=2864211 RepID=UPI0035BA315E